MGLLRILQEAGIAYDENSNGCFVNLSEVSSEVVDALVKHAEYVEGQERDLESTEERMAELQQEYFKEG